MHFSQWFQFNKFNARRLSSVLLASAISGVGLVASPITTFASEQTQQQRMAFNIASQPLSSALVEFSQLTERDILAPAVLVEGKQAPALKGSMTADEAMSALLAGSGLVYSQDARGGFRVEKASDSQTRKDAAMSRVIEEILVTAEKRSESLQSIPIAISAFDGEAINDAGVEQIADLKRLVPSLQFGEETDPKVTIRGVGQNLVNAGSQAGVALSINNVPLSQAPMYDFDFLDVERVEVLRGPQGTISGRNATGGAINLYTRLPTEEIEGRVKASIGNYENVGIEAILSGPIAGDTFLARVAIKAERAEGWLHNTLLDEYKNSKDKVLARTTFLAKISDSVEAHLILEGAVDRGENGLFVEAGRSRFDQPSASEAAGIPGNDLEDLEFLADHDQRSEKTDYSATLGVVWEIDDNMSLTSTTSYHDVVAEYNDMDYDGSGADFEFFPYATFDAWQISQELTFTAGLTENLDMIVGGFYLDSNVRQPVDVAFPDGGIPAGSLVFEADFNVASRAIYTQWRYSLTDALRLTVGGRYTWEKAEMDENKLIFGTYTKVHGRESWGAFTPRFVLDFSPSDNYMIYASVSKGYKAGGYSAFGNDAQGGPDRFDPEYVWNYEVGTKASFLDRRVRVALTAFYMDYSDFQAAKTRPDAVTGFALDTDNAAGATNKGIEFEFDAQLTDALRVTAVGTFLEAKFDEYETRDQLYPELNFPSTGLRDLSGNSLPLAPDLQFALSAEYEWSINDSLTATMRGNYRWQDDIYFTVFNYDEEIQKSFGLLDLSAFIENLDGSWRFSVSVNNLLDERYRVSTRTDASAPSLLAHLGAPRMYSVSIEHRF